MTRKSIIVWRPDVPHETYSMDNLVDARDFAVSLSAKHPGVEFHILESVNVVVTQPQAVWSEPEG